MCLALACPLPLLLLLSSRLELIPSTECVHINEMLMREDRFARSRMDSGCLT